jgi:pimeloyl-ACP methyl ester carboxylesterase
MTERRLVTSCDVTAAVPRATVIVEGRRISYQYAGPADGEPIVLLHGLASDSGTWDRAVPALARHGLRVIAVDLLGHGESDRPACGYLLEDFARCLDGFLDALGLPTATLCGHSLGGAVAVHFGFHHPGRVSRLVLVSAGGLGREVHPVLRAAALPGAPRVLGWAMAPGLQRLYGSPALHRLLRLTPENVVNLRRAGRALRDAPGRAAFFAALRGVIEPSGQRGSFLAMEYLAEQVPTLLVWSERDGVIPVTHARATNEHLPGSRLVVFPGRGHEPHRRHADAFADAVAEFVVSSDRGPTM